MGTFAEFREQKDAFNDCIQRIDGILHRKPKRKFKIGKSADEWKDTEKRYPGYEHETVYTEKTGKFVDELEKELIRHYRREWPKLCENSREGSGPDLKGQYDCARNKFWGTLERGGKRIRNRELRQLYVSQGHEDLFRQHRAATAYGLGSYFGFLSLMTIVVFATDHHPAIDLGIGCVGIIPLTIASVHQKKIRLEFNRRVCERQLQQGY